MLKLLDGLRIPCAYPAHTPCMRSASQTMLQPPAKLAAPFIVMRFVWGVVYICANPKLTASLIAPPNLMLSRYAC